MSSSQLTNIFQRGRYTTNQPPTEVFLGRRQGPFADSLGIWSAQPVGFLTVLQTSWIIKQQMRNR